MSTTDQILTPPPAVVREVVRARRIAAHAATTAMLASLAPEPTAETWRPVGGIAEQIVAKLARRTGRAIP